MCGESMQGCSMAVMVLQTGGSGQVEGRTCWDGEGIADGLPAHMHAHATRLGHGLGHAVAPGMCMTPHAKAVHRLARFR